MSSHRLATVSLYGQPGVARVRIHGPSATIHRRPSSGLTEMAYLHRQSDADDCGPSTSLAAFSILCSARMWQAQRAGQQAVTFKADGCTGTEMPVPVFWGKGASSLCCGHPFSPESREVILRWETQPRIDPTSTRSRVVGYSDRSLHCYSVCRKIQARMQTHARVQDGIIYVQVEHCGPCSLPSLRGGTSPSTSHVL